jgi:hypothetical protein
MYCINLARNPFGVRAKTLHNMVMKADPKNIDGKYSKSIKVNSYKIAMTNKEKITEDIITIFLKSFFVNNLFSTKDKIKPLANIIDISTK